MLDLSRVHMIKSDGSYNNRLELHVIPLPMSKAEVTSRLIIWIFLFGLSVWIKYDTFIDYLGRKDHFTVFFYSWSKQNLKEDNGNCRCSAFSRYFRYVKAFTWGKHIKNLRITIIKTKAE